MSKESFDSQSIAALKAPDKRIEIFDGHPKSKGLGLRVTPNGTKTFFYRYRFGNRIRRFTIGRFPGITLAEARRRVQKLKVDVNDGIDPQEVKRKKKQKVDPVTFSELANEFKDKYLPTLRESTSSEYKRIIDNELIPNLGKYPFNEISQNQIVSLLDEKAYGTGKQDPAPTMANRIRARLSRMFTFGIERGLIDKNPVQLTSTYSQGETRRDRFYSVTEIRELWHFFEEWDEPAQSVLKMLLICGQRKTETMNLRWKDIENNVWTIPAELAKNKQPHDVPLPDLALQVLERMKPLTGKNQYVFSSPKRNDEPIEWIKRATKHIKDNSKVNDFRPHDLRRTAATYMSKLGVNRTVLGKILNHKGLAGDSQVTAIYDRHSYMDEKRKALNQWSYQLNKIISDEKVQTNIHKMG